MEVKNYAALLFSLVALGISLFNVVERRRDTRREARLQFGLFIDELSGLDFDEALRESDLQNQNRKVPFGAAAAFVARRHSLCRSALTAEGDMSHGAQAFQILVIADGLAKCREYGDARYEYERVLNAEGVRGTLRVLALRGWARCLFLMGEMAEARERYSEASTSALPDEDVTIRIERCESLLRWARDEFDCGEERRGEALLRRSLTDSNGIRVKNVRERLQGDAMGIALREGIELTAD